MPKKKNQESQEEQSERFKQSVADLVAAGELNPTEADEAFERLVRKSVLRGSPSAA
jgi:polyhydroxyalkanoate synthesis regulator phasin